MPEYHYRFICTKCGEKLAWEGDDHSDDFYIEPCQTCLQEAAQQSVQADGADTWRKDNDLISDDYQSISAWCPNGCGKTMQVVRPGKFQCSECG